MRIPETATALAQATRAEDQGWDGITFTDSQNLVGDPFVAVALCAGATSTLRFATGVTNAYTRHPAALATVAATVQEATAGRFVLGIGRGDTALFHLGRKPMPVAEFARRTGQVQTYLAGGTVDCDGHPSRLQWLDRATQPKVPLDVACSGPRLLEFAGRTAERITLGVGADPERVAWALDLARKAAADAGRDPAVAVVRVVRERRLPPRPRRGPGPHRRRGRRLRPLLVHAGVDRRRARRRRPGRRGRGGPALRLQPPPQQPGRPHRPAERRLRGPLRRRRPARALRRAPPASWPPSASTASSSPGRASAPTVRTPAPPPP